MRRACDRASARDAMDADDAMGDAGDGDAGARGRAATTAPRGEGAGRNQIARFDAIVAVAVAVDDAAFAGFASARLTEDRARDVDAQTISAGSASTATPRTERCARDDARRRARRKIAEIGLSSYECDLLGKISFARDPAFLVACA